MYPFSYKPCATLMVWRAEKRSLRAASCCSVDVLNGAAGRRVYGFESTEETTTETEGSRSAVASACAACSSRATASAFPFADDLSWPLSSKSRPVATRVPSSRARRDSKGADSVDVARSAERSQYPAATKASRSRSRSTTRRVAADCTRPAESPGPILRQSTGETS